MSITISLSGEFLAVAQSEKKGIYMYVDKTLYETIHFWKEPTEPTMLHDSAATIAHDEIAYDEEDEGVVGVQQSSEEPTPSPEPVVFKESSLQKGDSITLSALPRAYWTTLFHLEAVKARNRPKAPPKAPEKAPFFLPTVVRDSTPSFPTPQEYAKLQNEQSRKKARIEGEEQDAKADALAHSVEEDEEEALVGVWEDREGDEVLRAEAGRSSSRILKDIHRANLPRFCLYSSSVC